MTAAGFILYLLACLLAMASASFLLHLRACCALCWLVLAFSMLLWPLLPSYCLCWLSMPLLASVAGLVWTLLAWPRVTYDIWAKSNKCGLVTSLLAWLFVGTIIEQVIYAETISIYIVPPFYMFSLELRLQHLIKDQYEAL